MLLKKITLITLLSQALLLCAANAFAQVHTTPDSTGLIDKARRGWWFYEDPAKAQPKKPEKPADFKPGVTKKPLETSKPEDPQSKKCKDPSTWDAKCGFIDPGMDYDFQAKERDNLLTRMSLSKNDPAAVEAFQYYMKWATQRAMEVANVWMYNVAQNPDLDPSVKAPISNFGVRLMTEVKSAQDKEVYKAISADNGGALIYFTRTDCSYCHAMAPSVLNVAKEMGIPVFNASLDTACIQGFKECEKIDKTQIAAQALKVTIVPSLFLFIKPQTWIRVATGMATEDEIKGRTLNFFLAYRNALIKGLDNGFKGRAPVDFNVDRNYGTGMGLNKILKSDQKDSGEK